MGIKTQKCPNCNTIFENENYIEKTKWGEEYIHNTAYGVERKEKIRILTKKNFFGKITKIRDKKTILFDLVTYAKRREIIFNCPCCFRKTFISSEVKVTEQILVEDNF